MLCPHCDNELKLKAGYINRAKKLGVPIYCSRVCSGLARRVGRTIEEKKAIKSEYDKQYRKRPDRIEVKKEWCKTPKGRAMQKRNRDRQKENHRKFIQTPEYRAWKKSYDEKYCAKKNYGEFWEAAIVLKTIEEVILPERFEAKQQKGLINKSQKRKRQWNSQQKI